MEASPGEMLPASYFLSFLEHDHESLLFRHGKGGVFLRDVHRLLFYTLCGRRELAVSPLVRPQLRTIVSRRPERTAVPPFRYVSERLFACL